MTKRMTLMIIFLLVVFGGIFGWNAVSAYFMKRYFASYQPPPATVSTTKVQQVNWQTYISSVGTLSASDGVDITPQASGTLVAMPFESGQMVKKGDLLAKIDDAIEQADLANNTAALRLAKISYERNKDLYHKRAISKSQLDETEAKLTQASAAVDRTKALIAQKNIQAPFDGKIGIKLVDTWQFVGAGTPLVTLQNVNPMKVNFYLPEQETPKLYVGQAIEVKVDTHTNRNFKGKITAIDAKINKDSHNILVQGTLPNDNKQLLPGLFANIDILLPQQQQVLVIPETAIDFSLFGDSVYVIEPSSEAKDKEGKPLLIAKRRFVIAGERQAGKVLISKGLKAGDEVVTAGQLKLSDGATVIINNSTQLA